MMADASRVFRERCETNPFCMLAGTLAIFWFIIVWLLVLRGASEVEMPIDYILKYNVTDFNVTQLLPPIH